MNARGDHRTLPPRALLWLCLLLTHCRQAPAPEHSLFYDLQAGDFLRVVVEQLGADVVLELRDAEGEPVVRVDSPNGTQGVEELVALAPEAGRYRLDVLFEAATGARPYRVAEVEQRLASQTDRELVGADREFWAGWALAKKEQPAEAAMKFRAALATFDRLGLPARQAKTLLGWCFALGTSSEKQLGVAICDRAVELLREQPDRVFLAAALQTGALLRLDLGQPDRALGPLQEALMLFEALGEGEATVLALGHLVGTYQTLGQLHPAVRSLEQILERSRAVRDPLIQGAAHCDAAGLLLALNRPREALHHFQEALAIYRKNGLTANLAVALRGLGQAASQLGDFDQAQRSIEEASSLPLERAEPGARISVLTALGSLLSHRGELDRGRRVLLEALELSRSIQATQREATALLELGYLEVQAHEPLRGLELLDQAYLKFAEAPDTKGQASAQARSAEALRDLGRLEDAWERLEPALAAVEGLRAETERRDLRSGYYAFRQDYYEIAVDLLMRLEERHPDRGWARQAFAVHERRLARELLEARARTNTEARPAVDPLVVAERARFEARLRALALVPPGEANEHEIGAVLARLERLSARARTDAKASQALPDHPAPDLRELQRRLLDPGSVLLAFSLGESRSFFWTVTEQGFHAHTLPGRLEIEAVARGFTEEARSPRQDREARREELGRRLAAMLLAPATAELASRRLVIVPQGILQAVPWAALPDPAESAQGRYLVEGHEIVLLPSVGTLSALRDAPRAARKEAPALAAFADPVYQPDDSRLRVRTEAAATAWPRLAHSSEEAERILAVAPSGADRLKTGFAASREALEQGDWSRFSALHFATHAEVHPEHPELSGLVLSLFDQQGQTRDGFLRAFEISRLPLGADLVVLSACETGVGEDLAGEGMASLARSFFEAGARRVVSSLWRVSDRSTARLMERFYQGYRGQGLSPAAALREAQRALLADPATSSPYRWAGFVVQGDGWDLP